MLLTTLSMKIMMKLTLTGQPIILSATKLDIVAYNFLNKRTI